MPIIPRTILPSRAEPCPISRQPCLRARKSGPCRPLRIENRRALDPGRLSHTQHEPAFKVDCDRLHSLPSGLAIIGKAALASGCVPTTERAAGRPSFRPVLTARRPRCVDSRLPAAWRLCRPITNHPVSRCISRLTGTTRPISRMQSGIGICCAPWRRHCATVIRTGTRGN